MKFFNIRKNQNCSNFHDQESVHQLPIDLDILL